MIKFTKPLAFEWDKGNIDKNINKHNVTNKESEESFHDKDAVTYKSTIYSGNEERHILLGKTLEGKLLSITFTIRKNKIRIISARRTNKKEHNLYEKET